MREVIRPVLDVLMLAYLLYKSWQILVQTRAVQLIKGTAVMVAIYAVSLFLRLGTLTWILNMLVPGLVIAIAIVFQPELRKIFTRIGSREWFRPAPAPRPPQLETVMGCLELLSTRQARRPARLSAAGRGEEHRADGHGAQRGAFHEPHHHGLLRGHAPARRGHGDRRATGSTAAGCFLPLSEREDVRSEFGARHRAALGLAEETDAVVVVVSEENGAVSLAHDGNIRYNMPLARDREACCGSSWTRTSRRRRT